MEILDIKNKLLTNIDSIFDICENQRINYQNEKISLNKEIDNLNIFNKKLIDENNEKDKLLNINQKTIVDYEIMINTIQDKVNKELSEKERFTMLKAQDAEIHLRDTEIKKLQKEINLQKKKNRFITKEYH